jgi:hypothetical protein
LIRKLLKNKKATAEVIGSVMFIIILLFFFTNVYLWHDAATKEMNDFYAEKLNSPISVTYDQANNALVVTNHGGVDAIVSRYWVNVRSTTLGNPDTNHQPFDVLDRHYVVKAGGTPLSITLNPSLTGHGTIKVITTTGNPASIDF